MLGFVAVPSAVFHRTQSSKPCRNRSSPAASTFNPHASSYSPTRAINSPIASLYASRKPRLAIDTTAQDAEMLRSLVLWKRCHDHFRIPEGMHLAQWLQHQLVLFRKGSLNEQVTKALSELGVIPDRNTPDSDIVWEAAFCALVAICKRNPNINLTEHLVGSVVHSPKLLKGEHALLVWICEQRQALHTNKLDSHREQRIQAFLGIDLMPCDRDASWERKLLQLTAFYKLFGHVHVSSYVKRSSDSVDNMVLSLLAIWIKNQKRLSRENRLSSLRRALLLPFGILKETSSETELEVRTRWEDRYAYLHQLYRRYAHSDVARIMRLRREAYDKNRCNANAEGAKLLMLKEFRELQQWSTSQRFQRKRGTLSERKIELLNAIEFPWSTSGAKKVNTAKKSNLRLGWNHHFAELCEFKEQNGHFRVARNYGTLGRWVNEQRKVHLHGKMVKERQDLLESIGFPWSLGDYIWMENYERLKARLAEESEMKQKGQKIAPRDSEMIFWVFRQRQKHRKGLLPPEYVDMLVDIGIQLE